MSAIRMERSGLPHLTPTLSSSDGEEREWRSEMLPVPCRLTRTVRGTAIELPTSHLVAPFLPLLPVGEERVGVRWGAGTMFMSEHRT